MEKHNNNLLNITKNNLKKLLLNTKNYAELLEKISKKSPFGKKSIFYTPPLENFSNEDDLSNGLKKS